MKINQSSQKSSLINNKKCLTEIPSNFSTYLLEDYTFLNEYELLDSQINTETQFLAKIKSTQQLVKFIKKPFIPTSTTKGLNMYKRFEAMFSMFQKGLILADNMFILEEGNNTFFYYVIEPYFNCSQSQIEMPFVTLQQYLLENRQNIQGFESRKALFIKCKNLIDNLSQSGQPYCGLNSRSIVIDDEGNTFLIPYKLEFTISNIPFQRSYYPIEILRHLKPELSKQPLKSLQKWDIWSFGCIVIEIFLYLTPYFMSTSVESQINRISNQTDQIFQNFKDEFMALKDQFEAETESQCSINENFHSEMEQVKKIMNFLTNAFNLDQTKRVISFESNEKAQDLCNETTSISRRYVKKYQRRRGQKDIQRLIVTGRKQYLNRNGTIKHTMNQLNPLKNDKQNYKQLNICQQNKETDMNIQEIFEFELKFKSIMISKCQRDMQDELQIMVQFSNQQKFKFFIDMPKIDQLVGPFEMQISKKITFSRKSFQFVENLLHQDIIVTVSFSHSKLQSDSSAHIFINLSSLTIRNDDGSRMWAKPIKGSYASQPEESINCKIKIQATLTNYQQTKKCEEKVQLKKLVISRGINNQHSSLPQQNQFKLKNSALVEQIQQTSRFRQALSQINQATNLSALEQNKIKNSKKTIDLSTKLKRLLIG